MDGEMAELIEWQARCGDLSNSLETVREERDSARSSVDLLMHENIRLEELTRQMQGWIDRLRLHIAQGVEL
jgi:hypothetical protein